MTGRLSAARFLMRHCKQRFLLLALVLFGIGGCAALVESLEAPRIQLEGIKLVDGSLQQQSFVLTLGVSNGNPIPLPIAGLDYALALNGQSFVEGKSENRFTVPANGATTFQLEINTNLLQSARSLRSLLIGGASELNYDLGGSVALDIPATRPLAFSHGGQVQLTRN